MAAVLKTLKHEFVEMLPPVVFFAAGFSALVHTTLTLAPNTPAPPGYGTALIGALLVAKGILLSEIMPFFKRFADRPRIVIVIWKAAIYFVFTTLLHVLERSIAAARSSQGFDAAVSQDVQTLDWSHFWISQMWVAILIFTYTALNELVRDLGHENLFDALFQKK